MMIEPRKELILFLRLAQAFRDRRKMSDRDRALVIAGTCASLLQLKTVANFCRALILQNNHGHMMKRWPTFTEAVEDQDFVVFLKNVRRKLSPEIAESKLVELEYECTVRKSDHRTNEEFAAAVMGVDVQWLKDNFSNS